MISNLFGKEGVGTVTGVDIAEHRLSTCRSLLKRYKVGERVRLFKADGTTFSILPPSRIGNRVIHEEHDSKRQKTEIVKPFWAPKTLRYDRQINHGVLYDKVLVDAECTHDGSIAHILKVKKERKKKGDIRMFNSKTFSMKNGVGILLKRILWTQTD